MSLPNDPTASHPQDAPALQVPAGAASEASMQADGAAAPGGASTEPSAEAAAPKQPMTPERMAEEMDRLDRVLIGLLVLLSFLLGSFAARNYDFWLQMANGREVIHGGLRAGEDPFTYTTSSGQWVNPCWLYDVLLYKISGAADYGTVPPTRAAILVVLKALAVTALGVLLLRIRRRDQSLWIPVACVTAAMLASSPRFLLQSTCISYLFLGITMYLLVTKPTEEQRGRLGSLVHSRFLLVPLFALWANFDYWFLLGPITVGLYLLAETLQQAFAPIRTGEDAPRPGELRNLAIVFVLSLAACLVNPYGFRIFTALPTDLWLSLPGNPLQDDDLFRQVAASPLGGEYFTRVGLGMTIAGFMYLPLLVAGVLSFAVNSDDLRWWRVTLWVAFCLLSAWMSRLIPFFAIVAAPITALNFQDFAARRFGTAPRIEQKWKIWSLGGRIASVVIGAVLLALAWPGWLRASVGDFWSPARVGWTITADPLQIQTVRHLAELQQEGLINKGFNLTPEIASYYSWFAPSEKAFFDVRFSLFSHKVTEDYVNIRKALRNRGDAAPTDKTDAAEGTGQATKSWPELFREYGIDHVVLTSDDVYFATIVYQMVTDSSQWVLLYIDGKNAVFGWMDPQKPAASYNALRARRLEPNQLAFAPDIPLSQRPPQSTRPPEPAPTPSLLTSYWAGPPAPPPSAQEANIDLVYFQIIQEQWPTRSVAAQMAANFYRVMTSAGVTGIATVPHLLAQHWVFPPENLQGAFDPAPAGAAYMALRAARRAIADNPEEAAAYRYLGESYQRLWHILETHWARNPQVLNTLRQVQLVSALQNALAIQPDSAQTHLTLARLLHDTNQWDLALQEMKIGLQQMKDSPPTFREENFEQMMAKYDEDVQKFEKEVQQRQNDYELKAKDKPPEYRAQLAYQRKLAGQALQDISEIDPAKVNEDVGRLIVKALLNMGRLRELQPFVNFEQPMDRAMVAAALGNYIEADGLLKKWLKHEDALATQQLLFVVRAQSLQTVMSPGSIGVGLNGVVALRRERADWTVVRGILALESGDTKAAARHFQEALEIGSKPGPGAENAAAASKNTGEAPGFQFETRPIAIHYLELLRAAGTVPTPAPPEPAEEQK